MPTIIDSLIVTLGLDSSQFTTGQKQAVQSLRDTEEGASRAARELSSRGRQGAEFFDQLKSAALSFLGVFIGAGGIEAVITNATERVADLGRQAERIGVSVENLDAFANAIERGGGNAQAAKDSLQTLANQMEQLKILGGNNPLLQYLNPIGATADEKPLEVYEKFVRFAQENKDDIQKIRFVGRGLGFTEDMITEARRGVDQYRKDLEESRRLGLVDKQMVENAQALQRAFEATYEAIRHIIEVNVSEWSPTIKQALDMVTDFAVGHPEIAKAIMDVVIALTALSGLRFASFLLGLGPLVSGIGAISGAAAGLTSVLTAGAIAAGVWYEALHPTSTQTDEQERELINKARIAHGEEPLPEPTTEGSPTFTRAGNRMRRFVSNMPEGPMKDFARAHLGSDEIADTAMSPVQKAFLQTLSEKESGGQYDIRQGGKTRITDFSQFPEGMGEGGTSSATGRYQFVRETWREEANRLGLTDMSPVSQDRAAWDYAERMYRAKTGGDLERDYAAGKYGEIANALKDLWTSLPGGKEMQHTLQSFADISNENLARNRNPPGSVSLTPPSLRTPPALPTPTPPPSASPLSQSGITVTPGSLPNTSAADRASIMYGAQAATPLAGPSTSTSKTDISIGAVNVHTQATDADNISADIEKALSDRLVAQANRGLQ